MTGSLQTHAGARRVYLAACCHPRVFAAVSSLLLVAAAPAAELPPLAAAKQLDPNAPVWVDQDKRRVIVEAKVCLREGVLELLACVEKTKEHESVLSTAAPPFLIHTALLAIGAEPGHPVRFNPEYEAPAGAEIEIKLEWIANGEVQTARAQDWVRYAESGKAMREPFVFAGSGFWTNPNTGKQHYLAEGGDLICVANFPEAMLDVPVNSTQANDGLWFEPYTERIPPVDTPVRMILSPQDPPEPGSLEAAIATISDAQVGDGSSPEVQAAWSQAASAGPTALTTLLAAMDNATPVAENWLRTAIDAVADQAGPADLPEGQLLAFLNESRHSPRARRTAFELLKRSDEEQADRLLDRLVDDPSLEIRYEAVAKLLARADEADEKEPLLRKALVAARTLDQIEAAAEGLSALGEEVSLVAALGLIDSWLVAGPFDNREGIGFSDAYPPELRLESAATFTGQDAEDAQGPFGWKAYETSDRLAEVELNDGIGRHKGAVGYAWATVVADEAQPIEVRYSSKCATKVWINGERVASNEVYHSGSPFDQYVARARLRQGENRVLVKACQNEQTEPWAQTWSFQLRLTGAEGAPLDGIQFVKNEAEE